MKALAGILAVAWLSASASAADVSALIKDLKSGDPDVRRNAAKQLAEHKDELKSAIPALTAALKDSDVFVRRFATQALGEAGNDKGVMAALSLALRDQDRRVVEAAAEALGKVGAPGVKPLIDLVKDKKKPSEVRRKAVVSLGKIGPEASDAVPALIAALKERDIQAEAVQSLGAIGPGAKEAVKPLEEILADRRIRDRNFKQMVRDTLRKINASKPERKKNN
jgi:HEAT repeat protein